nr:hypothetical protein [Tanacetum cinerariifolium]
MRLQALLDKKKVIIKEATLRDALRLDYAEVIECLPNEEIFAELARMGYEKPSTKLTFYKAFSQASGSKGFSGVETPLFKGMIVEQQVDGGYINSDDIRPIFEKHFDSNVAFLQKIKEHMDEEDSRVLKRLNESQEGKAAKKQKLDEEVEELKRHLQIVPNDENDVYTEATPLALKITQNISLVVSLYFPQLTAREVDHFQRIQG